MDIYGISFQAGFSFAKMHFHPKPIQVLFFS